MAITSGSTIAPSPLVPRYYQQKWGTSLTIQRAFHAIVLINYDCIIALWYPSTDGISYNYYYSLGSRFALSSSVGKVSPNNSHTLQGGITLTCGATNTKTVTIAKSSSAAITALVFQDVSQFVTGETILGSQVPVTTSLVNATSCTIKGVHHLLCAGLSGFTLIWVPSTNDAPAIFHLDSSGMGLRSQGTTNQTTNWSQYKQDSTTTYTVTAKRTNTDTTTNLSFASPCTGVIFSFN